MKNDTEVSLPLAKPDTSIPIGPHGGCGLQGQPPSEVGVGRLKETILHTFLAPPVDFDDEKEEAIKFTSRILCRG